MEKKNTHGGVAAEGCQCAASARGGRQKKTSASLMIT